MARDKKNAGNTENIMAFEQTWSKLSNRILTTGIVMIFLFLPLWLQDGYFDILEAKYKCFYIIALGMILIWMCVSGVMCLIDRKEFHGVCIKRSWKQVKQNYQDTLLKICDAAVLIYWIGAAISTWLSKYRFESFWGNEGRYSGLFLISIYVLLYWIVSHHWRLNERVMDVFLATGLVVCVFGILHYFKFDPLNLHENVNPDQIPIFVSTLGNINSYTAYVGMITGFSGVMYVFSDKKTRAGWYFFCYIVSLAALITGISDNAYLSVAALLGVGPVLMLKKEKTMLRYLLLVVTFFSVCLAAIVISNQAGDAVVGLQSICGLLGRIKAFPYFVGLLWVGFVGIIILVKKNVIHYGNKADLLVKLWIAILGACVLGVIVILWYANGATDAGERLGGFVNYLQFDDYWGNSRGYIWKFCVKIWNEFPVSKKVWGYGPETFGILTLNEVYDDMVAITGQFYDNAHNEYMQLLVTNGILGVVSYVLFLLTAVIRMLKSYKKSYVIAACGMAVCCYAIQATVNLNLPVVTPFMWVLLSIGMAGCRKVN